MCPKNNPIDWCCYLGFNTSTKTKRKADISACDEFANSTSVSPPESNPASPHPEGAPDNDATNKPCVAQSTPLSCHTNGASSGDSKSTVAKASGGCGSYFQIQPNTHHYPIGSAKEYVESLHQNSRSQLIYGKNNVTVKQVNMHIWLIYLWLIYIYWNVYSD